MGQEEVRKSARAEKKLPRGATASSAASSLSLSALVHTSLATVAEAGVEMPEAVRRDLRTAIDYHKRVTRFCQSVSYVGTTGLVVGSKSSSEGVGRGALACARDQRLISQLECLDRKCSKISEEKKAAEQSEESNNTAIETQDQGTWNFHLLALSDEDNDEDTDDPT
jgi:hypothetical protein